MLSFLKDDANIFFTQCNRKNQHEKKKKKEGMRLELSKENNVSTEMVFSRYMTATRE